MSLLLLLGGARSGKSRLAVELATRERGPVVFVATAQARDADMRARIAQHRADRPASWQTIEEPYAVADAVAAADAQAFVVVDCVTLWVSNLLERDERPEEIERHAHALATAARSRARPVIAISNEVGLGIVPAVALGRAYRDLLGRVNALIAAEAEDVAFVVAGRALFPQPLEGRTWT